MWGIRDQAQRMEVSASLRLGITLVALCGKMPCRGLLIESPEPYRTRCAWSLRLHRRAPKGSDPVAPITSFLNSFAHQREMREKIGCSMRRSEPTSGRRHDIDDLEIVEIQIVQSHPGSGHDGEVLKHTFTSR